LFDSFMIFSWFESFWFVAGCSSVLAGVREPDLADLDVHCSPPVLFWNESTSGSA